jgi:glycosyltransferase involved in cell wall biosynthesis
MLKHSNGLALFFTTGVSLANWAEAGLLPRELDYYRRLRAHVGPITFVTYGGEDDAALAPDIPDVRVLSVPKDTPPEVIIREYRGALGEAAIFKSNQIKGAEAAIHAGRTFGRPAIVRCGYLLSRFLGGSERLSLRVRLGMWRQEWRLFHAATHSFLPSPEDAAYARNRYLVRGSKITILPNFVDTTLFAPMPDATPKPGLIGFVGRLAPQKNLPALLRAVQGLPGASLRVIGDGPDHDHLAALADQLGARVEWCGRRPQADLPRLLAECQVFTLPSFYEGHPKVLLEAMALGLPVVGTPVMGTRPLIAHGRTGWLCADTSAEAIRAGLQALLEDDALRARLGRAARDYVVETFSLESVLAREVATYKELGIA